jgi:hypothetical protein
MQNIGGMGTSFVDCEIAFAVKPFGRSDAVQSAAADILGTQESRWILKQGRDALTFCLVIRLSTWTECADNDLFSFIFH